MEDFEGRVAFVTGAASGIGYGLCERFGQEGMKVVMADVEATALAAASEKLSAEGVETLPLVCDVSSWDDVEAAARQAFERFGNVHVLCNNAGVAPSGPLDEAPLSDWTWGIGIMLMGVVHGIKAVLPHMKEKGEGGHIVNTSSLGGMIALPNMGTYTAAKYAVVGITEVLRGELAESDVSCSVICPSFVNTRLGTSGRNRPDTLGGDMGEDTFIKTVLANATPPSEIAEAVVNGIREDKLYIFPHADTEAPITARWENILSHFQK